MANVEDFYSAMDVFVLPSLYEGFPVVSIEVQAAGLPLYASDNIDRSIDVAQVLTFFQSKRSLCIGQMRFLKRVFLQDT